MPFDDSDSGVWYDDQGRPHLTVAPNAPVGNDLNAANPLPIDQSSLQDYLNSVTPNPGFTHEPWINPIAKGSVVDQLTGMGGAGLGPGGIGTNTQRYQLFPERIVRSALSLPADVMPGKLGPYSDPDAKGAIVDPSGPLKSEGGLLSPFGVTPVGGTDNEDELLQRVQDMAALMGGGGMAPKVILLTELVYLNLTMRPLHRVPH